MNDTLFERLLYEEESTTLDFKRDQYRFVKASDDDKSELLKDILGFANAWRRSESYILIGIEDVRGGRANLFGIAPTEHLDDHSLQQFVNNQTNRPIRFHYEAFGFDGKQVGIIRIEEQNRPIFLKKDYGRLKKGEVYVRRGSSTDPTKPADPDEIAQMGIGLFAGAGKASLSVEFAEVDREQPLGEHFEWTAEFCQMPAAKEIPKYELPRPKPTRLPGGNFFPMLDIPTISSYDRLNPNYYYELAQYFCFKKFAKKLRLVVTNTGEILAANVRLEIPVPKGMGYVVFDWNDLPKVPKRKAGIGAFDDLKNLKIRPAVRPAGSVEIEKNDAQIKLGIECGSLQPGRKVWTGTFFMGIFKNGEIKLTGHIFADNLTQPQAFTLTINATVAKTVMTVNELVSLEEPRDDDDD